jgi:hypothetical protein
LFHSSDILVSNRNHATVPLGKQQVVDEILRGWSAARK